MSSVASIAAAAAVSAQSQVRQTLATQMIKMNAESQQALVALLQAGSENLESIAKSLPGPGLGQNVDISA